MRFNVKPKKALVNGWSPQLVSQMIVEMKRAQEPLELRSLYIHRRAKPDEFLSKMRGRPTSKKDLHRMACRYFGSWRSALIGNNIRLPKSAHHRFWHQSLIIDCIKHLARNGHALTVTSIWRDHSRSTSRLLAECTGRWTTGAGMHNAAQRFFGTWDEALSRSGIDPEYIKEKPFWSKRKMVAAIQAIHEAKIPLNVMSIGRDKSKETSQVIEARIGKPRTGRSLYTSALWSLGSWDRALKEAGLNPKDVRIKRFRWHKKSIIKVLKALHQANVALNAGNLQRNSDESTRSIIQSTVGRSVQGRRIYGIGRSRFKSWDDLLRISGFTPGRIRKKSARCLGDKEWIVEAIQLLHFSGHDLSATGLRENTKQIQNFIEERFGSPIGGCSILSASKREFGSWNKALWESGLNPTEICRRSAPNTTHLPTVLYQVEDVKINGERRREKYLGAPPKAPDVLLEENSAAERLKQAVDDLKQEEQELTERIFEAILNIHHYRDQKQLIQYVSRYLGDLSEKKIGSILSGLAERIQTKLS